MSKKNVSKQNKKGFGTSAYIPFYTIFSKFINALQCKHIFFKDT